jgi:aconitate hydratase/homoaconitate hydratase
MEQTYQALGRPAIHNKDRFYLAVDHTVDPITLIEDPKAKRLTQLSRDFAQESDLTHFYDANETILHTKFYRDLIQPGQLVLGADSHTSSHGGVGAFAIGLGGADVTVAMVLGESWIEVPEAIEVVYQGAIPFGFTGKDVILRTLGDLGRNTVAMERSVEYKGSLEQFTPDMRFTIANMTAEFGGLNGVFEADEQVARWLERRGAHKDEARYFKADHNAEYVGRYEIDLSRMEPQLAQPFSPDNVRNLSEVAGMSLDGAFIGACTTTEEELVLGALVLEQALAAGHTPTASDKRLVIPGDLSIAKHLRETGLADVYERAGFKVGVPGCSMCLGIASEKASEGEVWVTSQNRNYQNRMGAGSLAWLASASTVAASAMSLEVTDPRPWLEQVDQDRFAHLLGRDAMPSVEVRVSEPSPISEAPMSFEGVAQSSAPVTEVSGLAQVFGDHIDTDAIIPGEFCHLTDLQELGERCFHYVAPGFAERVRAGAEVIIAGEAWGSGSSREHAVWALKGAGVKLVIAKSYAFIHKRNLVNEALPYLQVTNPAFYAKVDALVAAGHPVEVKADLTTGALWVDGERFEANTPSPMVVRLNQEGGIVPTLKAHNHKAFAYLTRPQA